MDIPDRQTHWQNVYQNRNETEVSWFEPRPSLSLDLVRATGAGADASIIDVGGGTSRLVDALIADGYGSLTVLDISAAALAVARSRLGPPAARVAWIVADVTRWRPAQAYDVWHDRAAFHFLTDPADRAAYVACLHAAVRPGGHVIIGTFAPDGPERCSGLPVVRHDAASLAALLGPAFSLAETHRHDHATPGGALQRFQFSRFRHFGRA